MPPSKAPAHILAKYELDEIDRLLLTYKIRHPTISQLDLAELVGLKRRAIRERMRSKAWQLAFNDLIAPPKDIFEKKLTQLSRQYLALATCGDKKVEERVIRAILISFGILKMGAGEGLSFPEPTVINMPDGSQVIMGPKPTVESLVKDAKKV